MPYLEDKSVAIVINLNNLTHNVQQLTSQVSKSTQLIAVIKAGAYGHGSLALARHFQSIGISHFAVATLHEASYLRKNGIQESILVLGNTPAWEMMEIIRLNLTASVCCSEAIEAASEAAQQLQKNPVVHIKVDTGMGRNGCDPSQLDFLMSCASNCQVKVEAIFSHFADSADDATFTTQQMNIFNNVVAPYRNKVKLHVANSGAVIRGIGCNLDFIRLGISLYGLPPSTLDDNFCKLSLRPILRLEAKCTLVKCLPNGASVGYSRKYKVCKAEGCQWVAVLPIGYADGYWRSLSGKGIVVRQADGSKCAVLGNVSMDAISIAVPSNTRAGEIFTVISDDFDEDTSMTGIANKVGTLPYEVGTRLSSRIRRVYINGDKTTSIDALDESIY